MADYNAFDRRLETLVVETRTSFAADVAGLSEEDRDLLARAIQRHPELASQIAYERTHTGFIREITVTATDIERLYEHNVALSAS